MTALPASSATGVQPASVTHQAAVTFLETLTAGTPAEPLRYFYLWDLAPKATTGFLIQDPSSIQAATNWTHPPTNRYVSVAMGSEVLGRYERMRNDSAAGLYGVYADIDIVGAAHAKPNLPPTLDAAYDLVELCGAEPTMPVFSGHGLQAWWLFERPWVFTTPDDAVAARRLLKRWVDGLRHLAYSRYGWDLDAVGDLARLMRLPGTINAKQGEAPVAAELLTADGPRYDPEELTEIIDGWGSASSTALIALPPEPQAQSTFTVDAAAEPPADKLAALLSNPRARASWDHDREDFADRSPSAYDLSLASIAMAAEDQQWSDQDVVDLLIACRRRNHRPPKLRVDYFNRTLIKARLNGGDGDNPRAGASPMLAEIEDRGLIPVLADALEDEHSFTHDDGGAIYRYRGGRYVDAAKWLPGQVREMLEAGEATKEWRVNAPKELGRYLAASAPRLWTFPPVNVVNVENGRLDVESGKLLPHTPEHRSKVQLPITYDPDAKCPSIDQFVRETFPEDAVDLAYELLALVMIPDMSVQKAVLLVGPGGNGKSVWLALMEAFLGVENYSTVPLHKLEADRFSSSRLDGMLANISADLPASDLKGSSNLKGITGGDRITVERKFHDSYDLQPFCKLIFSANTPPRTPDASDGFFQRWIVIPFERSFRGEVHEISSRVLNARLQTPGELSGLLNQALTALQRLRANGLSEPLSCLTAREAFRAATDPVSVWIDQKTLLVPGAITPKAQLLQEYNADAINGARPTISANLFGRSLRRNPPTTQRRSTAPRWPRRRRVARPHRPAT